MKKIVVFTDFSERSENAAQYAVNLGRSIHANIILYHAYLSPASQPYAAQVAWPLMNSGELELTARKELELTASKLSKLAEVNPATAFIPKIETRCAEGELTDNLEELLADREIVLFIMANHRKGFSSLITGNHLNKMLGAAKVPVLIVPAGSPFKAIHKIAFATDLTPEDIGVLQSLSSIARHGDASIMLAHISADKEHEQAKEKRDQVQQFLCEVSNKINYPHIYYRHIQDIEVSAGLKWVSENVAFDLLAMVHHQRSFLEGLFKSSHTKTVATDANMPLLIYPHGAEHYPVF
jgi:nucleotide-binding universal stress UspA family protein